MIKLHDGAPAPSLHPPEVAMPGKAPGPLTALLIAAPSTNSFLYPSNGVLAVVQANLIGTMPNTKLRITHPESVANLFPQPVALFPGKDTARPNWHRVHPEYAGHHREITGDEYANLYREWWFRRGGSPFSPDQIVSLKNGARASMAAVWELFLLLRTFAIQAGAEGWGKADEPTANTFELLARLVHGIPAIPPRLGPLANLRNVAPRLAQLILQADDSLVGDMIGLLEALVDVDPTEPFGPKATLASPWPDSKP